MPRTGDGPFQRGERLTATRLNDLAKGVPVFMTGGTITESPTGKLINVDQPENIYIRLTGKTGTSPIKYAWKEVVRLANGTWLNTPRTANYTDDYAIELNNSNLSTTDNYVYRAERSPHSGEWLFFLRRQSKCSPDGYCLRFPTTINFSTAACNYNTSNAPVWKYTPNTTLYNGDECKVAEYPDGWVDWLINSSGTSGPSAHYQAIIDYASCLANYNSNSGSLTLNSNVRTESDISSLISSYFPSPLIVKSWAGSINPATDCPAYSGKKIYSFIVTKAVTFIEANLTGAPSCGGFNIAYKRGYDIELQIKVEEYTETDTLYAVYYTDLNYALQGLTSNSTAPYYYPVYTNSLIGQSTGSTGGDCDATGPVPFTFGNITFSY